MYISFILFGLIFASAGGFAMYSGEEGGIIFVIFGLLFASIPMCIYVYQMKKKRMQEYLKRSGDYVRAKVTFVGYNTSYKVNGRSPMYFQCEYLDRDTNKMYVFKSKYFWHSRLEEFVKKWIERKIYINRMNMKQYYVEVDDIPQVNK